MLTPVTCDIVSRIRGELSSPEFQRYISNSQHWNSVCKRVRREAENTLWACIGQLKGREGCFKKIMHIIETGERDLCTGRKSQFAKFAHGDLTKNIIAPLTPLRNR